MQPFVNYNLPDGVYLTSSPAATGDWTAERRNRWTVPIGGGVGKVVHLGKVPVNNQIGAYYNVERPEFGARWQLRAQVQFLFPR